MIGLRKLWSLRESVRSPLLTLHCDLAVVSGDWVPEVEVFAFAGGEGGVDEALELGEAVAVDQCGVDDVIDEAGRGLVADVGERRAVGSGGRVPEEDVI